MRSALSPALAILASTLVAACGTPEYHQARQGCHQEWLAKIPPDYRQVLVNRERSIRVPDGTSSCTTTGNTTNCKQGMRTEWIPYTTAETVDANEHERDLRIDQCTRSRCIRTYGNPDCKV